MEATRHGPPPGPVTAHDTGPSVLAATAAGGALGTAARYGVALVVPVPPEAFPWATLFVNVTGSLALAVALVLLVESRRPGRYLRPFAGTGFLGAYTTYSTFAVETDLLLRQGRAGAALGYTSATFVLGLAAAWSGAAAARVVANRLKKAERRELQRP